jgi:hypothetical protein
MSEDREYEVDVDGGIIHELRVKYRYLIYKLVLCGKNTVR